jgi:hypothetical protein
MNKLRPAHFVGLIVLVVLIWLFGRTFFAIKKIETPKVGDNLETGKIEGSLSPATTDNKKLEMKAVDGFKGSGYLVKKDQQDMNAYELFADLPELQYGKYVGWLVDMKDKHYVQLGDVILSKGGWYLYFETKGNVDLYDRVWITQERKYDEIPEKLLLEIELKKAR